MENDVLKYIPEKIHNELKRIERSRRGITQSISELRIRCGTSSSVLSRGERIPLSSSVCNSDIEEAMNKITGGSLYSFRESIKEGYISLADGTRVGICGKARYEDSLIVGVSDIRSLIYRVPSAVSCKDVDLAAVFERVERGLLVFSAPGGGKTTVLRNLAKLLGTGRAALNIAVADERCEFAPESYLDATVDILSGYKKAKGMEIALRTLSPDVILVDEIGGADELEAILSFLNTGVKIVATVHAGSIDELFSREAVGPLLHSGAFDTFLGIELRGQTRIYTPYFSYQNKADNPLRFKEGRGAC